MVRTCEFCGEPFEARRSARKTCSEGHRAKMNAPKRRPAAAEPAEGLGVSTRDESDTPTSLLGSSARNVGPLSHRMGGFRAGSSGETHSSLDCLKQPRLGCR